MDTSKGSLGYLIPFECIVDIDFGIIRLLKEMYANPDVFYLHMLNADSHALMYELWNRKDYNPLTICMKPDTGVDIDELYREILDRHMRDIIERSCFTDLYYVFSDLVQGKGNAFTYICDNEEQMKIAEEISIFKGNSIIMREEGFDVSDYNIIYVKLLEELLLMDNVEAKSIYIANYPFNKQPPVEFEGKLIDQDVPDMRYMTLYADRNDIFTIDLYNDIKYEAKG